MKVHKAYRFDFFIAKKADAENITHAAVVKEILAKTGLSQPGFSRLRNMKTIKGSKVTGHLYTISQVLGCSMDSLLNQSVREEINIDNQIKSLTR